MLAKFIHRKRLIRSLCALIAAASCATLQGCATGAVRTSPAPVPMQQVGVPGIPAAVRFWGDDPSGAFGDWLEATDAELSECCAGLLDRPHSYLVISSGGVEGAFGAGLLAGWTAAGTRPEFQLVTGVSAGAMIAPFAFLGSAYDESLREIYTNYSSDDLLERRRLSAVIGGDAVMDTAPLRRLIDKYLGDAEIAKIAAEGRKGRKLLIGTTNLNARQQVVWDLTRIAGSGSPGARQLIGDLILASSSIPGVFPPMRIGVEDGGGRHEELHVDGGVTAQLFLDPPGLDWERVIERLQVHGRPEVYVIRNARAYPWWTAIRTRTSPWIERLVASLSDAPDTVLVWEEVEPRLSPIVMRSMASMLRTRAFNDAVRIYIDTHGNELGFNLARIPDDFSHGSTEFIDRDYMRALFERGYAMALDGNAWLRRDGDAELANPGDAGALEQGTRPSR
jgi:hypothetical protein